MAVIQNNNPTLLDMAKLQNPDGTIAQDLIEILSQTNEIIEDITFLEGNTDTGHQTTIRTGLPVGTWGKIYQGVVQSKSEFTQITESTATVKSLAVVASELIDKHTGGNKALYRLIEEKGHLEGLTQSVAETIFYGDSKVEPEKFHGFAPRFNDLSAPNGKNILDAGGTGSDNTSIWLVTWAPDSCHCIVPRGIPGGIQVTDVGEGLIDAPDGIGQILAYRTHYSWSIGLCVRDWRKIARIANIDKSLLQPKYDGLTNRPSTGADLPSLMFQAYHKIKKGGKNSRMAFYMSNDTLQFLSSQSYSATATSTLTVENVGGHRITTYHGIPIRVCDVLEADEARIV